MAVKELLQLTTLQRFFLLFSPFSMLGNGLFIRNHILGRWALVATRGQVLGCDWLVPYLKSLFEDSIFSPHWPLLHGIGFLLANTHFLSFSFFLFFLFENISQYTCPTPNKYLYFDLTILHIFPNLSLKSRHKIIVFWNKKLSWVFILF